MDDLIQSLYYIFGWNRQSSNSFMCTALSQ